MEIIETKQFRNLIDIVMYLSSLCNDEHLLNIYTDLCVDTYAGYHTCMQKDLNEVLKSIHINSILEMDYSQYNKKDDFVVYTKSGSEIYSYNREDLLDEIKRSILDFRYLDDDGYFAIIKELMEELGLNLSIVHQQGYWQLLSKYEY